MVGLERTCWPTRALEVRPRAQRPLEAGRRDLDGVVVEVRPQNMRHALAERVVDPLRMVDVDAEALLARELEREHFDARDATRLCGSPRAAAALSFSCDPSPSESPPSRKMGAARPFRKAEMW